jgi:hypothetical protein
MHQPPEDVLRAELTEVVLRRQATGLLPSDSSASELTSEEAASARERSKDNLVGLALSGGGIRSASFNLGVLQAFQMKGLLKYVDYLSTVSGGSYIGAFLSSLAVRRSKNRPEQPMPGKPLPVPQNSVEDDLGLCPNRKNGAQPAQVRRLMASSVYLNALASFANRYLIGVVLVNVVMFSGLICLATLIAYTWRWLDMPITVNGLVWLSDGHILEWNRPFLPGLALLAVWFALWIGCFLLLGSTALTQHSGKILLGSGGCLLIGLAIWLGTPNMNWSNTLSDEFDLRTQSLSNTHISYAYYILAAIAVGLIPFLHPSGLLNSGVRTDSLWRQWIFRIAGFAMILGVPFAAIYLVGHHNAFGMTMKWSRPLSAGDVLDWEKLFGKMRAEYKAYSLNDPTKIPIPATPGVLLFEALKDDAKNREILENLKHAEKLRDYQHPQKGRGWEGLLAYNRGEMEKTRIAAYLDDVIRQPDFVKTILTDQESIRSVRSRLDSFPHDAEGLKEAKRLTLLLDDRAFRLEHPKDVEEAASSDDSSEEDESQIQGHLLLRAFYHDYLRPVMFVSRPIVIEADQTHRLWILLISGGIFIVSSCLINFNWTSMHGFYRTQLSQVFIAPAEVTTGHALSLPLQDLVNTSEGLPYHLLSGSVEIQGPVPTCDKRTEAFLFSKLYCGCTELGYRPTKEYRHGENTLSSAVAISGAAVNPLQMQNLFLRFLLTVTNFRLGQWLPNPGLHPPWFPKFVPLARIVPTWCTAWLLRWPTKREKFVFAADGGFHENLGIEALLQRRCRLIIASDAGADPKYLFEDFVKVFRRCRIEGIRFFQLGRPEEELAMNDIAPAKTGDKGFFSRKHRVFGRLVYPDGTDALFVYLKSSVCDPETIDIQRYRTLHPDFPHESTANQFFSADQFDAYRELGYRVGMKLCDDLTPAEWHDEPVCVERLIGLLTDKEQEAAEKEQEAAEKPVKGTKQKKQLEVQELG